MRGDEERAAALAAYLESGILDDRIAGLDAAICELRDLLDDLSPAAAYIEAVGAQLATEPSAPPSGLLNAIRLRVADLSRAAVFYRDGLGLEVLAEDESQITLDSGRGIRIVIEARSDAGDADAVSLEFGVDDLFACVSHLRELNIDVRMTRERGVFRAEVVDPDGHEIVLR